MLLVFVSVCPCRHMVVVVFYGQLRLLLLDIRFVLYTNGVLLPRLGGHVPTQASLNQST